MEKELSVCDSEKAAALLAPALLQSIGVIVNQIIRIKLKAYDHRVLDQSLKEIVDYCLRGTAQRVAGPVPLPTAYQQDNILRSPHVDKKSREQV